MDPLQQLWELYEEYVEKPELRDSQPATIGTPDDNDLEHPVTQQRKKVDILRATGMDAENAHQAVYGEVDTGDATSKAEFASTLGRVQHDGEKKSIRIEKDSPTPSILAIIDGQENRDAVTPDDFKTPQHKEVPNELQSANGMEQGVSEELDLQEEIDYNFDVAYLQKYGRA